MRNCRKDGYEKHYSLVSSKESTYNYSGYGRETDVSLDCSRFYGPFVLPQMRMSEGANE
jgi:hypothetical protein